MTIVYLVRHAHAAWQTDEQRPLSARGTADAERIAALLAREPISAIYSSPARRAQQTVAPLAQRLVLPILIEVDLRERVLSAAPVDDFMTAIRACWDNPDRGLDGGESNQAAQRRGVGLIDVLIARHADQRIVLATHGNLLALVLQRWNAGVDLDFWHALTMPDLYAVRLLSHGATIERLWS